AAAGLPGLSLNSSSLFSVRNVEQYSIGACRLHQRRQSQLGEMPNVYVCRSRPRRPQACEVALRGDGGKPMQWRMVTGLSSKQAAVDYVVEKGWLLVERGRSVCLTEEGCGASPHHLRPANI